VLYDGAERFSWNEVKRLLVTTFREWNAVEAPRMGASLAYYTLLSLAPLLIVLITVASFVFGEQAARGALMSQIQGLVGSDGARAIQTVLQQASEKKTTGAFAAVVGFLTLLFGASSVALELRSTLNKIWGVREQEGVTGAIKERSYAVLVVLGAGFLLLVSLVISAVLASMEKFFGGVLPIPASILEAINFLVSLAVITGVFAAIYKFVPSVSIRWHDALVGGAFTALLFTIGKTLIGIYLGKAAVGSAFGAAGSLVIVLVWVYYSAQILFFGAEFTRIYSMHASARTKDTVPAPVSQSK